MPAPSPHPQPRCMSLLDKPSQLEEFFDCPTVKALGDPSHSPCHLCDAPFAALLPWAWPTLSPSLRSSCSRGRISLFKDMLRGFHKKQDLSAQPHVDVIEGLLSPRPHPVWKGCRGERQGSLGKHMGATLAEFLGGPSVRSGPAISLPLFFHPLPSLWLALLPWSRSSVCIS